MAITIRTLPNLAEAIREANEALSKQPYTVLANEPAEQKGPVYLHLSYADGTIRKIGITHLVHLRGEDWDSKPFEEVARTTNEVKKAILARIALFFVAVIGDLHIDENGTIFDFNDVDVKVNPDKTFSIDKKPVTYEGTPFLLTRILGEGIVSLKKQSDGNIAVTDPFDKRVGKAVFIKPDGTLYRA